MLLCFYKSRRANPAFRLLFLFGFVIYHALFFRLIESSESLVYVFDVRERVGIFFDYVLEVDELRFIDKADYHFFILVRIAALTVQTSNTVVQFFDNFLLHLLGVVGNNRKLIRRFGARYYAITGKAADKAVQKTHAHRAVVVFHNPFRVGLAVHEIACDCDNGVYGESHEKEVKLRVFFA